MSTIRVHNWKVTDADNTGSLVFVRPEYHPTYWEIPKWWYKGNRTVYTSCVRIDVDDVSSMYIDGTSPLMQIQIDWDGSDLTFSNWRDIDRIMVINKGDLGAINRGESNEYDDYEFTDYSYALRGDEHEETPTVAPLTRVTTPSYDASNTYEEGSDVVFTTATYTGGLEPITYRYRIQQRATSSDSWTNSSWSDYSGAAQQYSYTITQAAGGELRVQSQARDSSDPYVQVNAFGSIKTIQAVGAPPVAEPLAAATQPEWVNTDPISAGDTVDFITATFTGGKEPVVYEFRWKERQSDGTWDAIGAFQAQTNTPTTRSITLSSDPDFVQIHIETRATDVDGARKYNNGPLRDVS